jgi:hypothetical protein
MFRKLLTLSILSAVFFALSVTPAQAAAYGTNGPDTIAATPGYYAEATSSIEKSGVDGRIRAHTKIQCKGSGGVLVSCQYIGGTIYAYSQAGSSPINNYPNLPTGSTLDMYSVWYCPPGSRSAEHTYKTIAYDIQLKFPNGVPTSSPKYHESFPTTRDCD